MDSPILFSGPMVRAILEGRKVQTRRVIKPQPDEVQDGAPMLYYSKDGIDRLRVCDWPYQIGDRLWVRETWRCHGGTEYEYLHDLKAIRYRADAEIISQIGNDWRPSIFMPKWACRIWLEIDSVRVERLREISEVDAMKEGCDFDDFIDARDNYKKLWDSLNGKRGFGWDKNPWVWVVEFKKVEVVS